MKRSHEKLDKQLLDTYLSKTIEDAYQIERSLDKGIVSLPAVDLTEPVFEVREVPEPKISKTPYNEDITRLVAFFDEIKDSELSRRGIRDFTSGAVKEQILPRHIRDTGEVNREQLLRERQIASNLDQVQARSQDLELS